LFLLGLLACPTIEAETDYQGPGLYKDGERVIDLQEMTASTAWGSSIAPDEKSAERKALLERIMGGKIPLGSAEQNAYFRVVLKCRELIQQSSSEGGSGPLSGDVINRLLVLESELDRAHKALREKSESVEPRLSDNRYSVEKSRQHAEVMRRRNTDADQLLALLSDLRTAQVSADMANLEYLLGALHQYFTDHNYILDQSSLDNGPRPMVMESKEPPAIESSELPESVKYPILPGRSSDPADLDPTIDVQFTDDIIDLAAELNHSPAEIYTFVRNNCTFESYLGSRKGSQQTLEHMRGNDYDLASLMIALLRVSGVPSRYASGRAYVTSDRFKNWLGFEDMYSALLMLNSSGFQIIYHTSGADTVGAEFNWTWVEAYMPFINYRGAINDSTGYQWVPLDPAFKQYEYNPGIYLYGDMNFDIDVFLWDYYSTFHEEPPIEMFKQLLEDSLAIYHPGATMEDIPRSRTLIEETDNILPGTLPYQLLTYGGSFSEIPDNMRYKIRFHAHGSGTDLDYTTSVPEIASKQVTLTYVGATPADQQIIDDAGGIWHVEIPWLVDLKPVLKIDGCEVARGAGQVMMGITHYSDMEFFPPTGAPVQLTLIQNYITAGNYQGLGIDTEDAFPEFFDIPETSCDEEYMGEVLHQTALTYLNNVDVADDELCGLMHIILTNDISEAIVENTVSVYYDMWGYPVSFDWTGMIVDADRKIVGPYSAYGDDILCDFMKLSGADGSIQENRVFETKFDEEAVSTIKIFELASDSGITLCHITTSIAADCPGLFSGQPPHVIDAINASLANGMHVIIPEREFTYYLWTGTGWISMDPNSCAAGYIISGGIISQLYDGGSTVQEWKVVYVGLQCLNPIGPITISPSASNNLYCAESNANWVFTVNNLEYIGQKEINGNLLDCQHLNQLNTKFNCSRSIKSIADDPELGPGEYTFKVYGAGMCPACGDLEEMVTIVRVKLESLEFTSDHEDGNGDNVLKKSPGDKCASVGNNYEEPEWNNEGRNNPITHNKNSKISVKAVVEVEPAGFSFKLVGDGPEIAFSSKLGRSYSGNPLDFESSESSSLEKTMTGADALPNCVYYVNGQIAWKALLENGAVECDLGSTGSHEIMVTLDTPNEDASWSPNVQNRLTKARISLMCKNSAKEATDQYQAASAMHSWVKTNVPFCNSNCDLVDYTEAGIWGLVDGVGNAQCTQGARLMDLGMRQLGVESSYLHIKASTRLPVIDYPNFGYAMEVRPSSSRIPLIGACPEVGHGKEELIMLLGSIWPDHVNQGEGCCLVGSKLYPAYELRVVGEAQSGWSAKNDVLIDFKTFYGSDYQRWRELDGSECGEWAPVPHRAPSLNLIGDKTINENVNLNFTVSADDDDNDPLTLTCDNLPSTATFTDNGDGTGIFDWTPGSDDEGIYNVTFGVTDGPFIDTETIEIEVNDVP